ncbi:RNA-binding protein 1 [Nymphaea thermarum]|nr:RNA-binding protein 1 [Nymphaea thermarum]
MADGYWRYPDGRQAAMPAAQIVGKRPRSEYDAGSLGTYMPHEEDRSGHRLIRDTQSIGASYDQYLRNGQISTYSTADPGNIAGGGLGRAVTAGFGALPVPSGLDPAMGGQGQNIGYGGSRPEQPPLPPDASSTLFIEGLPSNCTRREVAHIFRPFVGYKEVRLVNKESRIPGGDPLVLCFVDFASPNHAMVALDALQGYVFDENDRDSAILRLQFARFPGPRSGRGRR